MSGSHLIRFGHGWDCVNCGRPASSEPGCGPDVGPVPLIVPQEWLEEGSEPLSGAPEGEGLKTASEAVRSNVSDPTATKETHL